MKLDLHIQDQSGHLLPVEFEVDCLEEVGPTAQEVALYELREKWGDQCRVEGQYTVSVPRGTDLEELAQFLGIVPLGTFLNYYLPTKTKCILEPRNKN